MTYTVTTRRSIPASETHTSLILKKTVTTELVNGGKVAVCVKLQDGRMAWGFGTSDTEAESALQAFQASPDQLSAEGFAGDAPSTDRVDDLLRQFRERYGKS